jgi:hypothetical protein
MRILFINYISLLFTTPATFRSRHQAVNPNSATRMFTTTQFGLKQATSPNLTDTSNYPVAFFELN